MHDLLLRGSPALDGLPGICCDKLLPLFLSASQVGFAGLCTVYTELLQRGVDGVVPGGVCFSALASAWNLFFSWRMKILFVLDSFSFFKSNCCWLALAGPFLLSFSFKMVMVFSADISFSSDRLWRPATILSMSRWTSGGRSGYCLFRWWSTRWACGFHGAGRVPLRSPDGLSNIIQIASLHYCSCCHILPFPWL